MPRSALLLVCALAAACGPIERVVDPIDPVAPLDPVDPVTSPLEGLMLTLITEGLDEPSGLASPPGDRRLFVLERPGKIRIVRDGQLLGTPALDISDDVDTRGEKGLTAIAFHPGFRDNRKTYVLYETADHSRLVEYRISSSDANVLDPASARLVLEVEQRDFFHQGGDLEFGPDGLLWVTFGDDGAIGDPNGNGQNPNTLQGAVLRIDVDAAAPYAIPPDNPFSDGVEGAPEIWAYGLRNPWRIAVDGPAGVAYIPDVGQFSWEEINIARLDDPGSNYGWSIVEGESCYEATDCETAGLTGPALVYGHDDGCAVIGGTVYRGRAIPELEGTYFYSDHCSGWIRSLRVGGTRILGRQDWTEELGTVPTITSFGTDAGGEIYLVLLDGRVYRIDPVRSGA